jgi:Amt family ammonium transporter
VAAGFSFIVTFVLARVLDMVFGLSVSKEEEQMGLDVSEHGERAYGLEAA